MSISENRNKAKEQEKIVEPRRGKRGRKPKNANPDFISVDNDEFFQANNSDDVI